MSLKVTELVASMLALLAATAANGAALTPAASASEEIDASHRARPANRASPRSELRRSASRTST
jgi:hypothetical protein